MFLAVSSEIKASARTRNTVPAASRDGRRDSGRQLNGRTSALRSRAGQDSGEANTLSHLHGEVAPADVLRLAATFHRYGLTDNQLYDKTQDVGVATAAKVTMLSRDL